MKSVEAYDALAKHIFLVSSPYGETYDPTIILANNIDDAKQIVKEHYGVSTFSIEGVLPFKKCITGEIVEQMYEIVPERMLKNENPQH